MPDQNPPLLQLIDVTRRFPGVVALHRVSFDLVAGEVHALVGENGAGKTTLINLLSGVLPPDEGRILLDGQDAGLTDPVTARRRGVVTVHQEADLFESLSVAENLALGLGLPVHLVGFVNWREVYGRAEETIARTGERIDVRQAAGHLSVGHRHMIQVAAAVTHEARALILDEPTSALSAVESDWLFRQIARLKETGVGVIYISHRQEEIFRLSDRITVLRDGRRVFSGAASEIDRAGLIRAMVGRETSGTTARRAERVLEAPEGPPKLEVRGLCDKAGRFRNLTFQVHAHEVVGVYGLIGAGRSEMAQTLFGLRPVSSGQILIDDRRRHIRRPGDAVRAGIAYLPEDRLREAICGDLSVRANAVLSGLRRLGRGPFASVTAERRAVAGQVQTLGIRCRSVEQPIGQLSGGNQQKVVLARSLLTEPGVLVLDEPTRGVDVGAKDEIHRHIRRLADDGCAVLFISSELDEVVSHADRVLVFREGRLAGEFDPAEATAADVASCALPVDSDNAAKESRRTRRLARRFTLPYSEIGLAVAIALLTLWLAVSNEQFWTPENRLGILTGASVWTILALGAAAVIIAGGIDISIGSLLALAAGCGGLTMLKLSDYAPPVTIAVGIAVGVTVATLGGLANAGLSLIGRVHPIVVTLGTMTIYRGMLIALTGGDVVAGLPPSFGRMATMRLVEIPLIGSINGALVTLTVTACAAYVWLGHTRSGRHIYALGSSPNAARLAGISQRRVWLTAFAGGGLLTGIAAMLELAKTGSMQSVMGTGYELRAIAAAVIGGVAITGGRGSVAGVVLGALLLSLLDNALVLWEVPPFQNQLVIGALILVAILLDRLWRWFDQRTSS